MLDEMRKLVQLIGSVATDRDTLDALLVMIDDQNSWRNAKALFHRIREKTLEAERANDQQLGAQYLFEEACVKTLYNFTRTSAPFDPDSPYWIVPSAFRAAKRIGIDVSRVVAIVA